MLSELSISPIHFAWDTFKYVWDLIRNVLESLNDLAHRYAIFLYSLKNLVGKLMTLSSPVAGVVWTRWMPSLGICALN